MNITTTFASIWRICRRSGTGNGRRTSAMRRPRLRWPRGIPRRQCSPTVKRQTNKAVLWSQEEIPIGSVSRNGKMEQTQMKSQTLRDTAQALVANDKGLLAMDESTPTCNKRFASLGIPQTVAARRAYREMIVTTAGLGECISGAILYDETICQQNSDGTAFVKILIDAGIIPGIKVDAGAKELAGHPGEKVTEGLDGLRDRLAEYVRMGARFAKWRAVITIGDGIPSWGCIHANAHALARYAALCQEV